MSVFQNYLDDTIWKMNEPQRSRDDGVVTIGYIGGATHQPDLEMLAPLLVHLIERYQGRLKLDLWGVEPPSSIRRSASVTWHPLEIHDYHEFSRRVSTSTCDIWIAPLVDNHFNTYKSAIKYFEYTALGGACVLSHLTPYSDVVSHQKDGYLAANSEEWLNSLSSLIEQPEERARIAQNARKTVRERWLMSRNYPRLIELVATAGQKKAARRTEQTSTALDTIFRIAAQTEERQNQLIAHNAKLQSLIDRYAFVKNPRLNRLIDRLSRLRRSASGR